MFKRFLNMCPLIAQVLANPTIKNTLRMISGANIELLSEILDILSPFDEATKEISESKYITGDLVITLVTIIESALKISTLNIVLPKYYFKSFSAALITGVKKYCKTLCCIMLCSQSLNL